MGAFGVAGEACQLDLTGSTEAHGLLLKDLKGIANGGLGPCCNAGADHCDLIEAQAVAITARGIGDGQHQAHDLFHIAVNEALGPCPLRASHLEEVEIAAVIQHTHLVDVAIEDAVGGVLVDHPQIVDVALGPLI